jgi:hypothetical protein
MQARPPQRPLGGSGSLPCRGGRASLPTNPRSNWPILRGLRKGGVLLGHTHQGERIFPAFQLANGRIVPVVAHVNLLLTQRLDHTTAAEWWANPDPLLGAAPVLGPFKP